jgi:excisionase family DNA binding protein
MDHLNQTNNPSVLGDALLGAIRQVFREEVQTLLKKAHGPWTKETPRSYLSVKEAADMASLASSTVRLYIRQGKLKALKVGRRVVIEKAELERFMSLTPMGFLEN